MVDVKADFSGSIPEYYDTCLGPAWFEAFAADLAQRLPARPPGDVLEIACGTGLATRRLRERLDPAVRLVEKRGVSLDSVIDRLAAVLTRIGGADRYRAPAQALVVEARAV